jgi:hypothetical protein
MKPTAPQDDDVAVLKRQTQVLIDAAEMVKDIRLLPPGRWRGRGSAAA